MIDNNDNKNKEIPDLEILFDLADLFKVFGDSTRIRIMFAISDNEMSVLSIAEALNMEQSTISHQLRVLYWSWIFSNFLWSKMIVKYCYSHCQTYGISKF